MFLKKMVCMRIVSGWQIKSQDDVIRMIIKHEAYISAPQISKIRPQI
jgi:hypothetical protein